MTDDSAGAQVLVARQIVPGRRIATVCSLALLSLVFAACEQKTPVSPTPATQDRVGSASLASLKATGEGCGVTETASDGSARGFSVPRDRLPFNLPAIRIDPATGRGDGRVLEIRVRRDSGAPMILECWVSGAATLQQIGDGVRASLDTARWHEMASNLERRAPLPDSASRSPASPAVLEFASEMLAPTRASAGVISPLAGGLHDLSPTGIQENAPACLGFGDCGCYSVSTSYDDTNDTIIVEFFFCDSTDSFNYPWMIANNYYEYPCGGAVADNRDKLAAMYYNPTLFSGTIRPSCDQFRSDVSSQHFTWSQFEVNLRYTYAGEYIGLFDPILTSIFGPDSIWSAYHARYGGSLTFSSTYRDPLHNKNMIPPGALGSHHLYGNAVDIANPIDSLSRPGWDSLYFVVRGLRDTIHLTTFDTLGDKACGIRCVHADWR